MAIFVNSGTEEYPEPPPSLAISSGRNRVIRGSEQQEDFWEELLDGSGHILLEARAGSGKSTSAREGMWRLMETPDRLAIRYCCFNKKIADEFAERCPPGVEVGTMHRFGLAAIGKAFGRPVIDANKSYSILDGIDGGAGLKRYLRKSIAVLVGHAKNHAMRPDDPEIIGKLVDLVFDYDIETWNREVDVLFWAIKVLEVAATQTSIVDFDDMLWLPVLHDIRFPAPDFLFIDEAQDLNPVQHLMAKQMCSAGRIIIIGDPFQSIYAFRGADSESIPRLRETLDAKVMPLTVSFRCPWSHVDLARELVPDFEAAPDAPQGEIRKGDIGLVDDAVPGELVLCRANAPIVAACLRFIARLRPAIVRGRAIGDQLNSVVRKVGESATIAEFGRNLDRWQAGEVNRLSARDGTDNLIEQVYDKVGCLQAIASACSDPAQIPSAIARLFSDDDSSGRVTFSTVHRAKGSEARRVSYIQIPYGEKRDKVRPPQQWEMDQRRNLRYVALTRSLDTLTLIS